MHQIIKNPTLGGGVQILLEQQAKSIDNNYTQTFNAGVISNQYFLPNTYKTLVFTCFARVMQTVKSSKCQFYHVQKLVQSLTIEIRKRIFTIITSFSGHNRARQQAVFLRLLYFGLCYKLKTVYGGLREGNITPYGNTLRRLNAVIETCHPIKVVVLLNRSGGQS